MLRGSSTAAVVTTLLPSAQIVRQHILNAISRYHAIFETDQQREQFIQRIQAELNTAQSLRQHDHMLALIIDNAVLLYIVAEQALQRINAVIAIDGMPANAKLDQLWGTISQIIEKYLQCKQFKMLYPFETEFFIKIVDKLVSQPNSQAVLNSEIYFSGGDGRGLYRMTLLELAISLQNETLVSKLLASGVAVSGDLLLHLITSYPIFTHTETSSASNRIARTLLAAGADPMVTNICGNTPLHAAVQYNNVVVCRALLSYSRVSELLMMKNDDGNTPLHLAIIHQSLMLVRELIAAKADVLTTNRAGKTAQDLAVAARRNYHPNDELYRQYTDVIEELDVAHAALAKQDNESSVPHSTYSGPRW